MTDGTRRRLAWSLSLLFAAAGVTTPRGAAADDAEVRSRGLFAQGEALAKSNNWQEACPLFQAAHDLHGTGGTALRAADCYERVGKYDRAVALYQYVVDHRAIDKMPERVAVAEGRVVALKKQLGLEQPLRVVLVPTAAIQAPPPLPPPAAPSKVPAYAAFGVGGVGLGVGGVFGGVALKEASDLKAACPAHVVCPQWSGTRNAAETTAWVANGGFAVAIAGVVTGVVLLATRSSPRVQTAVRSAVGSGGLTLRF